MELDITWDRAWSRPLMSRPPGRRMSSRAMASGSEELLKSKMSPSRVVDCPMLEHRESRPRIHPRGGVEIRDQAAGSAWHAGQHLAPVIDDHRVAVSLTPVRMHAPLGRCDQATQVLDGPRA